MGWDHTGAVMRQSVRRAVRRGAGSRRGWEHSLAVNRFGPREVAKVPQGWEQRGGGIGWAGGRSCGRVYGDRAERRFPHRGREH